MYDSERFAVITGLPIYGERANILNVEVNDVVSYKVKGRWIFSVVIGTTPTMIKVVFGKLSARFFNKSVNIALLNIS